MYNQNACLSCIQYGMCQKRKMFWYMWTMYHSLPFTNQLTVQLLIRVPICAVWFSCSLSTYELPMLSHNAPHISVQWKIFNTSTLWSCKYFLFFNMYVFHFSKTCYCFIGAVFILPCVAMYFKRDYAQYCFYKTCGWQNSLQYFMFQSIGAVLFCLTFLFPCFENNICSIICI